MQTLKVTFYPISPVVVPDRPLHLDALLGAAVFHGAMRAEMADALDLSQQLPLERATGSDGNWCWKASQLSFQRIGGYHSQFYVRRYDLGRWALDRERGYWFGKTEKISQGSGEMKACTFTIPVMVATRATAWCVGDRDEVEALLRSEIHTLGRDAGIGWGWLRDDGESTTVEVAPLGESEFWRRRSLPDSLSTLALPGHHPAVATCRPPYWDRSQRQNTLEFAEPIAIPPPRLIPSFP